MLTKIIYKNFRSNLKNYILFFLSNIVAIMELFVFYGIRSIIKNSITDKVTAEAFADCHPKRPSVPCSAVSV